jgi:pseudouridine-5'-phosphate glycosidase
LVALESAVITHGLPRPQNLGLAKDMEAEVRGGGAIPATIAVLDGQIQVGLRIDQLERLASTEEARKISVRDFSIALAQKESGGTTVAGSLFAAHQAGIRVFATGGIGGIHRNAPFDISADLPELARTPMLVVCSGAKSILDLPATFEYLETAGIPVIGYNTGEFPAFYTAGSGLPVTHQVTAVQELVNLAKTHWELGLRTAILVVNPPPPDAALTPETVEKAIHLALAEAAKSGIHGPKVTPFLLQRVNELTGGASLRANLGLLRANARLAGEIAMVLSPRTRREQRI